MNSHHPDAARGCAFCSDGDGGRALPQYGVAPHECFWRKGADFTIGQSTLLPVSEWQDAFVPDLMDSEDWSDFVYPSACGVFYCPHCDREEYEAAWAALVARIGDPPVTPPQTCSDSCGQPTISERPSLAGHANTVEEG